MKIAGRALRGQGVGSDGMPSRVLGRGGIDSGVPGLILCVFIYILRSKVEDYCSRH